MIFQETLNTKNEELATMGLIPGWLYTENMLLLEQINKTQVDVI